MRAMPSGEQRLTSVFDRLEDRRTSWLALGVAMAVYAALVMWLTRGTTLYIDEMNFFTVSNGLDVEALLSPLNGHLALTHRLIFAIDFKLFGAEFVPLRIVEVVGAIAAVAAFFALAARRLGPAAALPLALLLLFFGSVWEINVVVSGIGNVIAVAAGLAALLALDGGGRRSEAIACALLILAVVSQTPGVAFAVGATVLILLQPGARGRLWVSLVPLGVYAAWLIWVRAVYVPEHGEIQNLNAWNILLIPNYIASEAASVAGALAGLNYNFNPTSFLNAFSTESAYGPVLATLAVGALVLRVRRGSTPFLWGAMAVLLAFWIALALGFGEGRNPTTVRYTYASGVAVLLIAAEAARGVRFSRGALIALYAIVLLALGANFARLRDGMHLYRGFATGLRAELTAMDVARDHVGPAFKRSSATSGLAPIPPEAYYAAVDRAGSPGYSLAELARQPEERRRSADGVMVQAEGIHAAPADRATPARNCRTLAGAGGSITEAVGPPGVRLTSTAGAELALRRYASSGTTTVGHLPANRPLDLRIPTDRSDRPWQLVMRPAPSSLRICDLPASG